MATLGYLAEDRAITGGDLSRNQSKLGGEATVEPY